MANLTLSVPDDVRRYLEAHAAAEGFDNLGDFVTALVHETQKHRSAEAMEALLLDGLDFSEASRLSPEAWKERKQKYRQSRMAQLRKEIAIGLEQLDRGEGIDGEEAFKRLREQIKVESPSPS